MATRIAALYSSSGISKSEYGALSNRVQRIFFNGQLYMPESFASGATVPVEPLGDFFPYLVDLNKQVEPDRSPPVMPCRPASVRRLTAENPVEAILARLQQFTSATLADRLVSRRAATKGIPLPSDTVKTKANGIAWSMRSALDYLDATPREAHVKRVLGLYYGTIAFAQAEMLASLSGPIDLDQVEGMTKRGHGLYALGRPHGGFADLRVGATLLFPTLGGLREYRTLAAVTLYALSIMARYLPSAWRRVEGETRISISPS